MRIEWKSNEKTLKATVFPVDDENQFIIDVSRTRNISGEWEEAEVNWSPSYGPRNAWISKSFGEGLGIAANIADEMSLEVKAFTVGFKNEAGEEYSKTFAATNLAQVYDSLRGNLPNNVLVVSVREEKNEK